MLWLEFAGILGVCFLDGADLGLLGATFRSLEESLGLTPMTLGLMGLAQASTMALAGPIWGWMCDTGVMHRQYLMACGAFGWGAMCIFTGTAAGVFQLIFARFLNGMFLASLVPLSQSWVAENIPQADRGRFFGIMQGMQIVGSILCGSITVTIASDHYRLGPFWMEGWRLSCMAIGCLSICFACLLRASVVETIPIALNRNANVSRGLAEIVQNLADHLCIPSFRVICAQGVVGSIPWTAMAFETMLLLYIGFEPHQLGKMTIVTAPSAILGVFVGGVVCDWAANKSPHHGRTWCAMFSVFSGIPCALAVLWWIPQKFGPNFILYFIAKTCFNFTASWCSAGVNRPMLNDIVAPRARASIVAWNSALEGTVSACFGLPVLGFIAERAFGYQPTKDAIADMSENVRLGNLAALQKACLVMYILPWCVCFLCYSRLHWTYEADLKSRTVDESTSLGGPSLKDGRGCDSKKDYCYGMPS